MTALGIDPKRVLERAGLGASRLVAATKIRASTKEFLALCRAPEGFGEPDLGLRIGSGDDVEPQDVISI